MFNYGGDNYFCDRFDFYKWSAPYYENPKEVFLALNKLGLKDKTLVSINAIGACRNIDNSGGTSLYWTIADAGIELGELWWERYEHLDSVLVPWNITLCEPIQFVFDDDTTLEILPIEDGGARIGVNTIPVGLVNGLNPSEVNATALFKEFIGRKLSTESAVEIAQIVHFDIVMRREKGNDRIREAVLYKKQSFSLFLPRAFYTDMPVVAAEKDLIAVGILLRIKTIRSPVGVTVRYFVLTVALVSENEALLRAYPEVSEF